MLHNHHQAKATTLEQSGQRVHRIDGKAAEYKVTKLVRIATLGDVWLIMVERRADLGNLILVVSRERTHTTDRNGRNLFEQALAIWSEDRW